MKITTFIFAAVATIASGMGSARASDDGWHLAQTLKADRAAMAQPASGTRIAMSSRNNDPDMTYGNG